ncbi:putative NOT transcription complex subunit VIP2 [Hordeum vulgare]|nr:putative NOT transcription complex subunit VIP2 [Hordeum vulgare]
MKVWGANLGTDLRARKGALLGQLQELDDLADGPGLSPDDSIRRNSLDSSLMDIFKSEELFWQRRGGQNWLLKGDANTAYFQGIANGRRRKCAIPFLWDGDALLESLEEISSHINSFYKEMFSAESFGGISLCEDFWPLAKQVSDTENAELTIPFSPEEVGHAIASMKACSAPGPDGLPVIFFQRFWETVHPAIMPMFQEFYIGTLDIGMLNFGVITLIPKVVGASDIRQFRPITTHVDPLRLRFPRLFAICGDRAALVAASAQEDGWHVPFRLPLGPAEVQEWETLQEVVPLLVSSERDYVVWSLSPSGNFSVSSAYLALCRTPVLPWLSPLWKVPLPLKIKIFVWQLLRDRLPSRTKVLKHHGPGNGTCPLCHVPENGTHILFSCEAAQALWGFIREVLGPEWEAHDLADFLQVRATQAGRKRRLFWLIFAALSWTLWTTRSKMVIERVFQRHASDSFFKFLAFLQHWHPLARPRDRVRLQGYLDALLMSARWLSPRPHDA